MTFLQFAPLKKKYLRANHPRFVNKEFNKAIMDILNIKLEKLG